MVRNRIIVTISCWTTTNNNQKRQSHKVGIPKVHSLRVAPVFINPHHMISPYKLTHMRGKTRRWLLKADDSNLQKSSGDWGRREGSQHLCAWTYRIPCYMKEVTRKDRVHEKGMRASFLDWGPESLSSHKKYVQWKTKPRSRSHPQKLPGKRRYKPSCSLGCRSR